MALHSLPEHFAEEVLAFSCRSKPKQSKATTTKPEKENEIILLPGMDLVPETAADLRQMAAVRHH